MHHTLVNTSGIDLEIVRLFFPMNLVHFFEKFTFVLAGDSVSTFADTVDRIRNFCDFFTVAAHSRVIRNKGKAETFTGTSGNRPPNICNLLLLSMFHVLRLLAFTLALL